MSGWFRLYDELLDDPKVQGLPADDFKSWINLLCLARRNGGRLPSMADIAFGLRLTEIAARSVVDRLSIAGLFDVVKGGVNGSGIAPHAWEKRQYKSDSSTERVKRFRNASKTLHATGPETETETEKKEDSSLRSDSLLVEQTPTSPSPEKRIEVGVSAREREREIDDEFNRMFWPSYPNKVGKPAARRAYPAARKRAGGVMAILAGLDRYVHDKPGDRPWLNPATFLNQDRWNDHPASTEQKRSAHKGLRRGLAAALAKRNGGGEREPGPDDGVYRNGRTIEGDLAVNGRSQGEPIPRLL